MHGIMLAPSKRLAQLVFACALGGYAIVAACGGSDSGPGQSSTSNQVDAGPGTTTGITFTGGGGGPAVIMAMDSSRQLTTIPCQGAHALPNDAASTNESVVGDGEPPTEAQAGSEEAGSTVVADAAREASSDAGECPLPASVCFDDQWLTYFTSSACVDGLCQ